MIYDSIKDEIHFEKLQTARLVAFGCPRAKFTAGEFDALKQYVAAGGSLLFMLGEGGETRYDTNVNFLLEDFGVAVNNGELASAAARHSTLTAVLAVARCRDPHQLPQIPPPKTGARDQRRREPRAEPRGRQSSHIIL